MKISWLKSPAVIDFLKSYFSRFGEYCILPEWYICSRGGSKAWSCYGTWVFLVSVSAFRKTFFQWCTILISPKKKWKAGTPANSGFLKSLNADIRVLRSLPGGKGYQCSAETDEGSPEEIGWAIPVQFLYVPKIKIPNSPLGEYNGFLLGQSGRSLGGHLIERAAHQKLRTSYKRVEGA